jgi:hypothetical protein
VMGNREMGCRVGKMLTWTGWNLWRRWKGEMEVSTLVDW